METGCPPQSFLSFFHKIRVVAGICPLAEQLYVQAPVAPSYGPCDYMECEQNDMCHFQAVSLSPCICTLSCSFSNFHHVGKNNTEVEKQ